MLLGIGMGSHGSSVSLMVGPLPNQETPSPSSEDTPKSAMLDVRSVLQVAHTFAHWTRTMTHGGRCLVRMTVHLPTNDDGR